MLFNKTAQKLVANSQRGTHSISEKGRLEATASFASPKILSGSSDYKFQSLTTCFLYKVAHIFWLAESYFDVVGVLVILVL